MPADARVVAGLRTAGGLSELADGYDAFVLDLWGVIHDGITLYEGAAECLRRLHAAEKRVVFLSNAPRRAAVAEAMLSRFGVPRASYKTLVTSGEVAHDFLKTQNPYGARCLFVGLESDLPVIEGLQLTLTARPAEADFVLCAGYDHLFQPAAELDARLAAWREAALPMLCINPDLTVVRQDGSRLNCAGHLAARYAALGGAVAYIGKPHARMYETVRAQLAGVADARILAVGDSLHTDILGANASGLACALVLGGIHAHDMAAGETLERLMLRDRATPDVVMPFFRW